MRRFVDSDLSTLNSWRAGHGLRSLEKADIPEVGFIVDGAAAGFLLRTETGQALLDGFITSPQGRLRARHAALQQIARGLCQEADQRGITRLAAFTQNRSIAAIAYRLGFKQGEMFLAIQKEIR